MKLLQADIQHSSRTAALKLPLPLAAIESPALLIDGHRLERNLEGMQALATETGVELRPHAKSHKSPAIARRQIALGATGVCVAKVSEAEVFAGAGVSNLLVAYPLVGSKAEALGDLGLRHPDLHTEAVVDSETGIDALGRSASRQGRPLEVWLKIDVGLHRCGLDPTDPRLEVLARRVQNTPGLRLRGLLTHAGQVYAAEAGAVAGIARREGESLVETARRLERAGFGPLQVSLGSTPTVAGAARIDGVDEIHPGVYVFGDRQQVRLGAMRRDDVALTVLATVVSRPAPGRFVLDAGSKSLSSDRGAHGAEGLTGYGTVTPLDRHRPVAGGASLPFVTAFDPETEALQDPRLLRLSEEHGVIESDRALAWEPGDRVEILPNHACAAVNLARALYVTRGSGENRQIVEIWPVAARARVQ
jgi:D-serine deaminase-like pyridoxal phosphate-dependent protein